MHRSTDNPGGGAPARGAAGPAYLRRARRAENLWLRALARVGGVAVLGVALVLGLRHSGEMDRLMADISGRTAAGIGLAAEQVEVRGLTWQSPQAVVAALGIRPGAPLVSFSPARAKSLLENLDWVKQAEVLRRYPNGLLITIEERQPIARWRIDGQELLVDAEGVAISSLDARRFSALPLLAGEDAQKKAAAFINLMSATPEIFSQLAHAELIGGRRWNLHMRSGLVVLLPERDPGAALFRLAELQQRHGILQRAVKRLDLRDGSRLVLAALPEAQGQALGGAQAAPRQ